ncbi:type II toxin-antitoxin system RelE/ParE family toxin [Nocardia carnea]|uniref:type II toxin-antitoxin system RelE/ParE family toxin n=1 Tax=Nocardia carnea TaxID=37328 RepID=UPI0024541706|nr:type II toxin-antitoxin system RelE/ParE family toxin [Nocardia carnea]
MLSISDFHRVRHSVGQGRLRTFPPARRPGYRYRRHHGNTCRHPRQSTQDSPPAVRHDPSQRACSAHDRQGDTLRVLSQHLPQPRRLPGGSHRSATASDGDAASRPGRIEQALDRLSIVGSALGRPLVDSLEHSRLRNPKELRPGSCSSSEIRMLFVFDPDREAIVLVAGDKAGRWSRWYDSAIPLAEERYADYRTEKKEKP